MNLLKELYAERRTYAPVTESHTHNYAQLIVPMDGEMSIQTQSQRLRLTSDTLFLVPPNCEHIFCSNGHPNSFIVLDIPSEMLPTTGISAPNEGMVYSVTNEWRGIRNLLHSELENAPESREGVRSLFPYISRQLTKNPSLPASIQYIHEHFAESITVEQLAAVEHYNRTHYSEWFRKMTGSSPSMYIQKVRLTKAKELLLHTDWPILHIAMQVGLEHQASLTRLFRRLEGTTPRQYREGIRSSE
ncbi:AraC family transcriptional regulator [Paenibacillus planticolens]|uniref:Helix-turn-helix domain-containing protein n=1 Tax=Paenibacillus planticolens TaxID=2654976 RepID=A0ABX1ZIZ3_9BACL|nr:AraC family transcriptional regulator [Paenibacillus planticolens]NOU98728.1 helix-turn-helix domain-containing protein [Paenibacillus planticolens]